MLFILIVSFPRTKIRLTVPYTQIQLPQHNILLSCGSNDPLIICTLLIKGGSTKITNLIGNSIICGHFEQCLGHLTVLTTHTFMYIYSCILLLNRILQSHIVRLIELNRYSYPRSCY